MSSADPIILIAAYLVVADAAVTRPRIPVYHDYVHHITTERPHLFRPVCHMNLDEAKALALILGIESEQRGHFKLSDWDRFIVFLIGAAQGTTLRHMESHLHLSKSAVSDNFKHFSAQIVSKLNNLTSPYAIRGFNKPYETLHIWKNVIGYVDGTHVRVQRPSDHESEVAHYSEHKKTHTVIFMVIVDIRGKVVYCSPGYAPGRASEKALYSLCDIFIPQQYLLLGDGAYDGCTRVCHPYRIDEITNDRENRRTKIKYNVTLRRHRVLIEWFFSRLKRAFRKLDHEWRDQRHSLSIFFLACCLILNFLAKKRNLYPINDFDPNSAELPVGPDDHIPNNVNILDDVDVDMERKYDNI